MDEVMSRTLEEFRAQIETNLFGTIILTKAVLRYFREPGAGHIIQVTSGAGRIGPIGHPTFRRQCSVTSGCRPLVAEMLPEEKLDASPPEAATLSIRC